MGQLLYCKERGSIICCINEEKCDKFAQINDKINVEAKEYLENTTGFIKNLAGTKFAII